MKRYGLCLTALLLACGARTPLECPMGAEGCDCDPYGDCEPGLVCQAGVCGPSSVVTTGGAGGQRTFLPWDTGGAVSSGGILSGGAVGAGGIVGTGGGVRTGGTVGSGGLGRTGGTVGTGGSVRTGGSRGMGGALATGGRIVASGGRSSAGGSGAGVTGSGGQGRGGAAGNTVTFANGRAEGAMTGWGWVASGELDTVSSPTCSGKPVTPNGCQQSFEWPSSHALCISGSIPAVVGGDYSSNWGIMLAANVSEAGGAGLGQSFQSITFVIQAGTFTNLRGIVHRKGDDQNANYCANITPGVAVSFSSFNTFCWDGSGISLTGADVPDLDWIGIQVYSSSAPVTVSNLCLTGLVLK